ncbi:MAG: right-handed parallel beta-helix repeat-containing protein, partial [Planctomycetota bacterium]
AYVHNLVAGQIRVHVGEDRLTPYLRAHSTEVAGLHGNASGDERYYNNIFVNGGLTPYDPAKLPVFMAGNVFLKGAQPSKHESSPLVQPNTDPGVKLVEESGGMHLKLTLDKDWEQQQRQLVTTALLGRAKIPDLPYEQADGSPLKIDADYFGTKRNEANPSAGPFEYPESGELVLKVWPVD